MAVAVAERSPVTVGVLRFVVESIAAVENAIFVIAVVAVGMALSRVVEVV